MLVCRRPDAQLPKLSLTSGPTPPFLGLRRVLVGRKRKPDGFTVLAVHSEIPKEDIWPLTDGCFYTCSHNTTEIIALLAALHHPALIASMLAANDMSTRPCWMLADLVLPRSCLPFSHHRHVGGIRLLLNLSSMYALILLLHRQARSYHDVSVTSSSSMSPLDSPVLDRIACTHPSRLITTQNGSLGFVLGEVGIC